VSGTKVSLCPSLLAIPKVLDTFKPIFHPQPVTPNDSSLATALAGRYAIERELGQGGRATGISRTTFAEGSGDV
jgi:hypothetical protein